MRIPVYLHTDPTVGSVIYYVVRGLSVRNHFKYRVLAAMYTCKGIPGRNSSFCTLFELCLHTTSIYGRVQPLTLDTFLEVLIERVETKFEKKKSLPGTCLHDLTTMHLVSSA